MELFKLEGIVLEKKDTPIADREILFLDQNYGKISLLAKGMSKSKRRETYATDSMVISEFWIYKNRIISKIALLDPLSELKEDPFKLRLSFYVLLLAKEILPFEGGKESYPLVNKILCYLKNVKDRREMLISVLIFFSKLLKEEGINFELEELNFDFIIKNGIIKLETLKKLNLKGRKSLIEILKNFNYKEIKKANLSFTDILTFIQFLEVHVNDFLGLKINLNKFMRGFVR